MTPAPTSDHQLTSGALFVVLYLYVKANGLGKVLDAPIDVILNEHTIVQPDIVYVETRLLPLIRQRGIEGPPTLIVEVLSPSTARIDRNSKFQLYARHGVPHYWLVDPDARSFEAYTLSEDGYTLSVRTTGTGSISAPPFPGLSIDLASVWP